MAHHFDYIEDPRLDITDVYCFGGNAGTVFVINVAPRETSGFNDEGTYEFKIDTNGDAIEDIAIRVTFPIEDGMQRVRAEKLVGTASRDRDSQGAIITPPGSMLDEVIDCAEGISLYAGERGEPFYNDPRLLIEIKRALQMGTAPVFETYDPATAQNVFADTNVSSIVLEVPAKVLESDTVGYWANTVLPTDAGGWRQLQHAAAPAIGFLWDFSGGSGVNYSTTHPKDQKALLGEQVVRETAVVIEAMGTYDDPPYGRSTPQEYAEYVRDSVLPDILTFNVGTQGHYGSRVRNGRGLTEDSLESLFELVLNTHVEIGLDASDATGELLDEFPYLSKPV